MASASGSPERSRPATSTWWSLTSTREPSSAAVDELTAAGASAHGVRTDVTDAASVGSLAELAFGLGPVRAVCMNAGVTTTGQPTWATAPAQRDFVFAVNFYGLFNSVAAFVPGLIEQGGPSSVVVTASMAGLVASPTSGAYAASKAAAVAYTKALAGELATSAPDVAVVLLCPGMVATNLMRSSAAHSAAQLDADLVEMSHGALNDLGATPADVAQWVFDALDERRLWAVPPAADPFTSVLVAELGELLAELGTGEDGDG